MACTTGLDTFGAKRGGTGWKLVTSPAMNGPYVRSAFFCERVLEERDNVLTPIRLIDIVTYQGSEDPTPQAVPLHFLISLV